MYESFYGLKEKPFSMLPDPGFLYLSKKHQKALTLFEYGLMNHAGFCVISGEIGSGKTTLLRKLLENMNRKIAVGMITNTHKGFGNLLDWVLSAFDIHEKGLTDVEKHQRFMDFLVEQYAKKKTTLLIVDEAQNMAADKLEELRMLSNINADKDQVLQIILAGQPELNDTLGLPELKQFVQRIAVDYHLGSLDQEDTRGYIAHRLAVAGAEAAVFTDEACDMIFKYSGGTPRLINLLCDTALVYGFADQLKVIDEDLVAEMILERMQNSLVPLACTEPPKKKARTNISVEEPSSAQTALSDVTEADVVSEAEHDLGEKVMQATVAEKEADQDEDAETDVIIKTEEVKEEDLSDSDLKAPPYEPEEVETALTDFSSQNTPAGSIFLKPLLVGLSVLVLATLFFALSLEDDSAETTFSEVEENNNKPELINRETTPSEQLEEPTVVLTMPDEIKKQLDASKKAQQEMVLRQQESDARMKALEEQAALMQAERDKALFRAKKEKEKRAAEAEAARIAMEREKEARAVAQKAIADAMAAEQKAKLLEELRIKEEREAAAALAAQQEKLDAVAASVEAAAAEAEVVEVEKEEPKEPVDIRCEGATARFLSICR